MLIGPFADHMLVPAPGGVPPARLAAASDNLADAWRTVVPPLAQRPGGSVLILGGGAKSIGLYAAGLAVASGAGVVDYLDDDAGRRQIAESFGARVHNRRVTRGRAYDVVVEATSSASGARYAVRALAPGGVAHATLQVVQALNFPAAKCQPVTAHFLKIYPPNQTEAVVISFTAKASAATGQGATVLNVAPVQPGAVDS